MYVISITITPTYLSLIALVLGILLILLSLKRFLSNRTRSGNDTELTRERVRSNLIDGLREILRMQHENFWPSSPEASGVREIMMGIGLRASKLIEMLEDSRDGLYPLNNPAAISSRILEYARYLDSVDKGQYAEEVRAMASIVYML